MAPSITEAKARLPLPRLLDRIGDGLHAKKSARCPFHEDRHNSFSGFQTADGAWLWKCHPGCGGGDGVDYLEKRFGLSTGDAIARYCLEAGVTDGQSAPTHKASAFDWDKCLEAFTLDQARELVSWRGYSPEFVSWLRSKKLIGIHRTKFALPVYDDHGRVVSCHYRASKEWRYHPSGNITYPLIIGDARQATYVLAFESQWDAFALMDKLAWHKNTPIDTAIIITRGSENGKLIAHRCSPDSVLYAFVQNDPPDARGRIPAEIWLNAVAANAGCKTVRVATPPPHKDLNDWTTRAGASRADIEQAISKGKIIEPPKAKPADISANGLDKLKSDVRGQILNVLLSDAKPASKRAEIAKVVVDALAKVGRFYYHAERRDFDSAMFFDAHRKRLERIRGDSFAAWISDWINVNRADTLFRFVLAGVETAALFGANTTAILPETFWAARPGAIYLSNGDGQAMRITAKSVELVDNGTDGVLFAAGRTLALWRLTTVRDPFQTCSLFAHAHCSAIHGPDLLRLWMYSLPTIPRNKPPICLVGEVGAGKTRLAKGVAEVYGLPFIAAKVEAEEEDSFWPNANEGGLYTLDNADTKCRWLADAVANASTDGCSQRRKLYTNCETVVLRPRAWLCLTTANPTFANDAGLADRLLVVRMERRIEEITDSVLTEEIQRERDGALSHIAETLCKALADDRPTPTGLNDRHPDFARFAVRIGRALGRETEAVAALRAAEMDKTVFCLENDAVGSALLAYLSDGETFCGDAKALVPHLVAMDPELEGRLSAKRLGKRLSTLWPHLQKRLEVARKERDRNRLWHFEFRASAECAEFQSAISYKPPREG